MNIIKDLYHTKRKSAFSLVELMIVIAIISILSAIAVPSYRDYVIKSRITSAVVLIANGINTIIRDNESNGFWPNPLLVYGLSLPSNTYVALSSPPVKGIWYYVGGVTQPNTAHLCIFLEDIGIPGYVTPTGNNGTYGKMCMVTMLNNDIYTNYCGIWDNEGNRAVPTKYLPIGCNCDYVANVALNGSTNCNH